MTALRSADRRRGSRWARTALLRSATVASAIALAVSGCADDGDLDAESGFCEEVRAREDLLVAEGEAEVPATLVGALRELVEDADAPDGLRDAFNELTEATSDEDLDQALADIEQSLAQCGVDMDG